MVHLHFFSFNRIQSVSKKANKSTQRKKRRWLKLMLNLTKTCTYMPSFFASKTTPGVYSKAAFLVLLVVLYYKKKKPVDKRRFDYKVLFINLFFISND